MLHKEVICAFPACPLLYARSSELLFSHIMQETNKLLTYCYELDAAFYGTASSHNFLRY